MVASHDGISAVAPKGCVAHGEVHAPAGPDVVWVRRPAGEVGLAGIRGVTAHDAEERGAVRLTWHTHENNTQSRAAITKLGANFEGLLRKHRRFGDGWRTTALYAMTDDEWPSARDRLLQRICP